MPAQAALELLARRKARRGLTEFTTYLEFGIAPAAHHRLLIERLEAVERGECPRLMVFMPPGSAKSTYASILFPAWYFGRNAGHDLILASHTAELAERFGRRVRNIISSDEYFRLFGVALAEDSQAAHRWSTSEGGEFFAAGVGGAITGRRGNGGIIDDPVKGREDADSETQRERAWGWYNADFYTRLKPGAWIVLIMTRWHEDDLAGRLLEEEKRGGEHWEILSLPAEAEAEDPLGRTPGEPLWPEWFDPEMFAQAKRDSRNWSALYQQRPTPDSGGYFKREWFRWYSERPKHLRLVGCSDYAVTEDGGDATEHGIFGIDPEEDIYVVDWWTGHTTPDTWIDTQCDLILKYRPGLWLGESGVIKRATQAFLTKRMRQRKARCRIEWLPSIADKPARSRAFQALASMGKVHLLHGADWVDGFLSQHLSFPAGKFDDKVDVTGLLGRAIDQTRAASKPTERTRVGPKYGSFDWLIQGEEKAKSIYRR